MERVIVNDLTTYLLRKKLISKHQHGFISRRSTTTNLLECVSDWSIAIDNYRTQTVIYIDFSRAFDTVTRNKLLTKLYAYGVRGDLLNLISDFLLDRSQVTKVGNCVSNSIGLSSGVVQGSCIGPLLFLIFINDLTDMFDSDITPKLYADDLKLYSTIYSSADSTQLQQNLIKLVEWSKTWQLDISVNKCFVLHVGSRFRLNRIQQQPYFIGDKQLLVCDTVKDLGVTVDGQLKFSQHIRLIVNKAFTKSYLIYKCFQSRFPTTLIKAYTVYVRPILEYCSSVWSPYIKKDINLIESVQRRYTKRIPGMYNMSYTDRLNALGLDRLDVRRLRADILLT